MASIWRTVLLQGMLRSEIDRKYADYSEVLQIWLPARRERSYRRNYGPRPSPY
jgi:hypothetical protein